MSKEEFLKSLSVLTSTDKVLDTSSEVTFKNVVFLGDHNGRGSINSIKEGVTSDTYLLSSLEYSGWIPSKPAVGTFLNNLSFFSIDGMRRKIAVEHLVSTGRPINGVQYSSLEELHNSFKIPCYILPNLDVSSIESVIQNELLHNLGSKEWTKLAKVKSLSILKDKGYSQRTIASMLNVSEQFVSQYISLSSKEDILTHVAQNKVSLTAARVLASLGDKDVKTIIDKGGKGKLTVRDVKGLVDRPKRTTIKSEDVIRNNYIGLYGYLKNRIISSYDMYIILNAIDNNEKIEIILDRLNIPTHE